MREEIRKTAQELMRDLYERHDVFAKGWHEPVYDKKVYIGDNCPTCGTHFAGLREDIEHLFVCYAEKLITASNKALLQDVREAGPKNLPVRLETVNGWLGQPYAVDDFNAGVNMANGLWRQAIDKVEAGSGGKNLTNERRQQNDR